MWNSNKKLSSHDTVEYALKILNEKGSFTDLEYETIFNKCRTGILCTKVAVQRCSIEELFRKFSDKCL